jgi:aryl-phospho-beta-D-glucosidase BglC (GH1 family)
MREFKGYKRGVNLGGWLSQGEYTDEHLCGFITEEDFKVIAGWGADHVRVPTDYNIYETDDGQYKERGFERVRFAIDMCRKYGLKMILDLHKTAGYSFDSGYGEEGFFESEDLQARFYALWEKLAEHFGGDCDTVAFELLNEVTDKAYSDVWNKIVRTAIERIRKTAPDVSILVGGYWNNSIDALADLDMPYDDKIVYNFHCYAPLLFTHQSAHWVKEMPSDFSIGYPGDIAEYRAKAKETGLDYMESYLDEPDTGMDAQYFAKKFAYAVKIAEERNVPLYCGEYGVIDKADPNDALKWYKDINAAFERFGIARAAWSYKQVDFGLSDEHMSGVIDEVKKYL